jgi:hypothetical protein
MLKAVDEYMNDPRILEDSEMMAAPECIREIHAISLKLHDETSGMSPEEHADYVNKKAEAILAQWGITPRWYTDITNEERVSKPIMAGK